MGMNGLVGRRRREHQALPGPRGCSAWASKVLSSLQKRGRRCAATSTVTPAWRAYRSPQAAQRQGPTAPARALTFTHRAGTTHLTQGSRDSETQRLAQNHQPGSREAAQMDTVLTGAGPGTGDGVWVDFSPHRPPRPHTPWQQTAETLVQCTTCKPYVAVSARCATVHCGPAPVVLPHEPSAPRASPLTWAWAWTPPLGHLERREAHGHGVRRPGSGPTLPLMSRAPVGLRFPIHL